MNLIEKGEIVGIVLKTVINVRKGLQQRTYMMRKWHYIGIVYDDCYNIRVKVYDDDVVTLVENNILII